MTVKEKRKKKGWGKGFESAGGKLNISGSCQNYQGDLGGVPDRDERQKEREIIKKKRLPSVPHRTVFQSLSIWFDLDEHLLSFQCQMNLRLGGFHSVLRVGRLLFCVMATSPRS